MQLAEIISEFSPPSGATIDHFVWKLGTISLPTPLDNGGLLPDVYLLLELMNNNKR